MKTPAIIAGTVLAAVVIFGAAVIAFVNMRGGVAGGGSVLASIPVVGGLVKVNQAPSKEEAARALAAEMESARAVSEIPFLRFGPEARLTRLAQELELKKSEYDSLTVQVKRKERELDAWQRQLKLERDNLRVKFGEEKEDIARQRDELQRREQELKSLQIAITADEQSNLRKTAEIYAKMSPERGAAILSEMYAGSERETVVKIIYLMQDRPAAKTLEAFTDPRIGAEITEELKRITRETQEGGQ